MKILIQCGWTYEELVMAIGMRALGEDHEAIAGMLIRDPNDVTKTLQLARGLIAADGWPARLLKEQEEIDHRLHCERPDNDRIAPFRPRREHPKPVLPPRPPADVTAVIAGDPTPEQRARIAERAAQEAEPSRPRRYY